MEMKGTSPPPQNPPRPIQKRYFGYATFQEYYQATSKAGHGNEGLTIEEAWQHVMNKLRRGVHISAPEWIRDELRGNPKFRTRPVWYFVMPEARENIPRDLLAAVDAVGAGEPYCEKKRIRV